MAIKELDKAVVKSLGGQIEAALQGIAAKHGLKIAYRGGSYSPGNAQIKIEISVLGEGGAPRTREADAFVQMAELCGFKPEHLNQSFNSGGHTYILRGMNTRAQRMPMVVERKSDGKSFKMTEEAVRRAFGLPAPSFGGILSVEESPARSGK